MDDKVMIKRLKERIAELEAEVELLRQGVVTTSKQQQQQQQHITSGPLLEGERKQCHQVLYNYLHGRLEDPVEAGECLTYLCMYICTYVRTVYIHMYVHKRTVCLLKSPLLHIVM